MTQQYRLASMAAQLSSTGISHHSLLPHFLLILLSTVNSSPHPGMAPQSPNSASLSGVGMAAARTARFSFHLGCHRSAVSLSLKCFSSDSDSCPDVGIRPLLQFSHLLRAGPVLLTLLFLPPSSFILPSFAWLCIFFSAGQVLLLTLSWCSACTSVSEGVFLTYP